MAITQRCCKRDFFEPSERLHLSSVPELNSVILLAFVKLAPMTCLPSVSKHSVFTLNLHSHLWRMPFLSFFSLSSPSAPAAFLLLLPLLGIPVSTAFYCVMLFSICFVYNCLYSQSDCKPVENTLTVHLCFQAHRSIFIK